MTNEEAYQWKVDPLTKRVFSRLREIQAQLCRAALDIDMTAIDPVQIAVRAGYNRGYYDAIEEILTLQGDE
jgi:hypothetical protein